MWGEGIEAILGAMRVRPSWQRMQQREAEGGMRNWVWRCIMR